MPSYITSSDAPVALDSPTAQPATSMRATELPVKPGAVAILVAAGMAARSPLVGREAVAAAVPGSPVLAASADSDVEQTTPGSRIAVGLGKLRTPGRRELRGILADPVAQKAAEELKVSRLALCMHHVASFC